MYTVYVLANKDNRLYIGLTNSLKRRIKEHNCGYHRSTKNYKPYRIIHYENFGSRQRAREREKFFKSGAGRELLKGNYFAAG